MNITIIEDDKLISDLLTKKLTSNWYKVNALNSKIDFMLNHHLDSDLYIIDIFLWDWDWFEIIKYLRETKMLDTPIIITSSYNDTERKIYWLDIWADDYLSKPFSPEELLARIRSLLRRNSMWNNSSLIKHNDIIFCLKTKELTLSWNVIHFTKKEISLIELFLLNQNKLINKSKIINSIWWNIDLLEITDNNINVIISKVRKKLWDNFNLKTVVNWGYILK